jgi:hypothetical protein
MVANATCMVLAQIENLNGMLQAILILATITYTVVRTVNEVKKIRDNGKADSDTNQDKHQSE